MKLFNKNTVLRQKEKLACDAFETNKLRMKRDDNIKLS